MSDKLPHLTGPNKSGYYRFQANMSKEVARKVSDMLSKVKVRFPNFTMSFAWCESVMALDELWAAQAKIDHALVLCDELLDLPLQEQGFQIVSAVAKALVGWPTTTTTKFVSEDSPEYKAWAGEQEPESLARSTLVTK